MILNEQEMQMARELARELMRVENIEEDKAKETACDALVALKEVVTQVWSAVKEVFQTIYNSITELHNENEHSENQNWHTPIKVEMPKMPDLQLNRTINIRSNI